jgi:apolipoprotein D and lipocalin family protein
MSLREAFARAIDEESVAQFKRDSRQAVVEAPPSRAFAAIRRIGGVNGGYFGDAVWRLRGWIDRGLGGVGMPRIRRDPDSCVVGDAIDGWRVEAYEPDRLLRLSAGLKLPGRGWLEFRVDPLDGGQRALIRQTATFDPHGISGRLYWYGVLPFHALVFRGMLRQIARHAVRDVALLDRSSSHRPRVLRAAVGDARPRTATRWIAAVALAAATTLQPHTAQSHTAPPVRTVRFVDLDRYAGDWFEIARFPNRFQTRCVGDARASYARRPDGRLDVVNRCRTADDETVAHAIARVVDEQTFAKLKVRFAPSWLSWLPMVWGDYWIVGLAPDYAWAVVGDPGRKYLWILARAAHLDDASAAAAWEAARENGFDVTRLVRTPHTAARRP